MKVKYLNENGYFKTPEEMKNRINNKPDHSVVVADMAKKQIELEISEFLTDMMQLNESDQPWYNGTLLNSSVFNTLSCVLDFRKGPTMGGNVVPVAVVRLNNNVIELDVHVQIRSTELLDAINSNTDVDVTTIGMFYPDYLMNKEGKPDNFKAYIPKLIKEKALDKKYVIKYPDARRRVLTSKLVLNKIHMFEGCNVNIGFETPWIMFGDTRPKDVVKELVSVFSFDNQGDTYIFERKVSTGSSSDSRTITVLKLNGNELEEVKTETGTRFWYAKSTGLTEGYFNNPTQAKAAIEKRKEKSSAENLAKNATDVQNNLIGGAIRKYVDENTPANGVFPLSIMFCQPVNGGRWKFTRNAVVIDRIDDDNQTIIYNVDLGNFESSNGGPFNMLVAVNDPRIKYGLPTSATPAEIKEALLSRNIQLIKNGCSKILNSKTFPKSDVIGKIALEKILNYKFVVNNIFLGILGDWRIKNLAGNKDVPDSDLLDMLFSVITLRKGNADARIIFKSDIPNIKNQELTGVPNLNDVMKNVCTTAVANYVGHLAYRLNDTYQGNFREHYYDSVKTAIKKELGRFGKNKENINIIDTKFLYELDKLTVIDIDTKKAEDTEGTKFKNTFIKVKFNFVGDSRENTILLFVLTGDNYWCAHPDIDFSDGLKPKSPVEWAKTDSWGTVRGRYPWELINDAKTVAEKQNVLLSYYCDILKNNNIDEGPIFDTKFSSHNIPFEKYGYQICNYTRDRAAAAVDPAYDRKWFLTEHMGKINRILTKIFKETKLSLNESVNEAYFNNPEQAKKAIEKRAGMQSSEKLAKTAFNVLIEQHRAEILADVVGEFYNYSCYAGTNFTLNGVSRGELGTFFRYSGPLYDKINERINIEKILKLGFKLEGTTIIVPLAPDAYFRVKIDNVEPKMFIRIEHEDFFDCFDRCERNLRKKYGCDDLNIKVDLSYFINKNNSEPVHIMPVKILEVNCGFGQSIIDKTIKFFNERVIDKHIFSSEEVNLKIVDYYPYDSRSIKPLLPFKDIVKYKTVGFTTTGRFLRYLNNQGTNSIEIDDFDGIKQLIKNPERSDNYFYIEEELWFKYSVDTKIKAKQIKEVEFKILPDEDIIH